MKTYVSIGDDKLIVVVADTQTEAWEKVYDAEGEVPSDPKPLSDVLEDDEILVVE